MADEHNNITKNPDEHNNISENNSKASPRGFTSKINLILIILVAVLTFAIGGAVLVAGVSNTPENRLSRHMHAAERYLAEMDYERAVIEYQRVLEIDPMNVDAILGLADAYLGLGEKEKAIEVLRDGLKRTGDDRIKEKLEELEKPAEPPVPPESEETPSEPSEKERATEDRESEGSESEKVESVFGSMGTVNICGVDIDIATTTSLLICNNGHLFLEDLGAVGIDDYELEFDAVVYLSDDWDTEEMKKIQWLSQLQRLDIDSADLNEIDTLVETIMGLSKLTTLGLQGNNISDIGPLASLTNLIDLCLDGNEISDIRPLSNLKKLRCLELIKNKISNINALSGLTNLTWLNLADNKIKDISALSNLINLSGLELYFNDISEIRSLINLKNLTYLGLNQNQISESEVEKFKECLPNCEVIWSIRRTFND